MTRQLQHTPALCLLFDRFDALGARSHRAIFGNLRALRDAHKYELTYITATRRPHGPAQRAGRAVLCQHPVAGSR